MTLENIIRTDLLKFNAYSSARDEAKKGRIWLNANESPFNTQFNRYPEKQSPDLINKISELFEINPNQLIISRGSDEVIDLLVRLCCTAGEDSILICPPTYGMYSVSARLQNAEIIQVPLLKNHHYQLDMENILNKKNKNIKIIFLCSPNNPTGNLLKKEDVFLLCEAYKDKSLVVVDEAYIDYADSQSLAEYISKYSNLVILRTFSKAYGLAGVRMGFLLANQEIIHWLLKIIAPYPLSAVVTEYVLNNLSSARLVEIQQQIAVTKSERERLFNQIEKMPWVKKIWPSEANYLLIETHDAKKIMNVCASKGIIIREMFDKVGLENAIRISIGLPEENDELIAILREII